MAKTATAVIEITTNTKRAESVLNAIRDSATRYREELKQITTQYKALEAERAKYVKHTPEYNNLTKQMTQTSRSMKKLEGDIKDLDGAEKKLLSETGDVNKILKDLGGATTRQLRTALGTLKRQLDNTSGSNLAKLREIRSQMKQIQAQIDTNTGAVKRHGGAWSTAMRNITAYIGMFAGLHQAIAKLQSIFKGNLEMSDQLSQIRMVSGLAMKDVNKLSDALKGLDTRSSLSDLQQIAYEGSKLGFGQYGVEGLKGFTEAANQVNVALKEQMGEDTLPMMSKMVENMGLIKKMGVEKAMLATGSAMFRLSASSTSSAGNIMEFAKRLAGLASTSHITTDQLLALGSASDSMMLMPEVAATAFNKFITSLQAQPKTIARAFKIPEKELIDMLKAGKTMDAMVMIFERMNRMGGMNALKPLFKDMGSDGARLNAVMVSMAKNVAMLKEHLTTSNEAFNEASDVTKEYNLRQETAQGYLERANNLWSKAFVNKDGVEVMKSITKQWYDFSESMTSSTAAMAPFKLALDALVLSLKLFIALLPSILAFFGASGVVRGINFVVTAIRNLTLVIRMSTVAWSAFNIATKANVIGAVAALIVGIAVPAITALSSALFDAEDKQKKYNNTVDAMLTQVSAAKMEVEGYRKAIDRAGKGTQQRNEAIKQFNKIYGSYLDHLLTEGATADEVAAAYNRVCTALQRKIALEAKQKDVDKFVTPRYGYSATKLDTLSNSLGGTQYKPYGGEVAKGIFDDAYKNGKSLRQALQGYFKQMGLQLTKDEFNVVYETRGATSKQIASYLNNRYGETGGLRRSLLLNSGSGGKRSQQMAIARSAAAFGAQYYATLGASQRVNNKWDPFIPPEPPEQENTFDNDQGDAKLQKKLAAQRAREHRAYVARMKRAMRAELKDAEDKTNGVLNAIDSYYNYQATAINDMVRDGRLLKQEADSLLQDNEISRLTALGQARLALAGKDNTFDQWRKENMGAMKDMVDYGKLSQDAYNLIINTNLDALHKLLAKFDGGNNAFGIDGRSFIQEIERKSTENLQKVSEYQKAMRDAFDGLMSSYNAATSWVDSMADEARKLGFAVVETRQQFMEKQYDRANVGKKSTGNGSETPADNSDVPGFETVGPDGKPMKLAQVQNIPGVAVSGVAQKPQLIDLWTQQLTAFLNDQTDKYNVDTGNMKSVQDWFVKFITGGKGAGDDGRIPMSNLTRWASENGQLQEWANTVNNYHKGDDGKWYDVDNHEVMSDTRKDKNGQALSMNTDELDAFSKKIKDAQQNILAFYLFLSKGEDDFYDRQKKNYDKAKRIFDSRWDRSNNEEEYRGINRQVSNVSHRQSMFGKSADRSVWYNMGFASNLKDNPEIMTAQSGLAKAMERLEMYRQQGTQDLKLLEELEDQAEEAKNKLDDALNQSINNRIQYMQAWIQPLEQFSEAFGENILELVNGTQKGHDALKSMLEDMVKSLGTAVIQMMKQRAMMQIQEQLMQNSSSRRGGGYRNGGDDGNGGGGIGRAVGGAAASSVSGALKDDINSELSRQRKISKVKEQGRKKEQKEEKRGQKETTSIVSEGGKKQEQLVNTMSTGIVNIKKTQNQKTDSMQKDATNTELQEGGKQAQGDTLFGISSGASKIIANLGWWGIPLVAVITALLQGLLNAALSKVFGGGGSDTKATTNTKLTTGMLTYDQGNVQAFRGMVDGRSYPVVGNDGKVYAATSVPEAVTGIVNSPIATMINGEPGIVGEKGPELVIGRETTARLMMSNPELIRYLVNFDRQMSTPRPRLYDGGNLSDVASAIVLPSGGDNSSQNGDMRAALIDTLNRINESLQKPARAYIPMYGEDSFDEALDKRNAFRKKYKR